MAARAPSENGNGNGAKSRRQLQARILICEDQPVIRAALRALLEQVSGFKVVAEAGNAADLLRYVGGHKPDVVVLDLDMPNGAAIEALPRVVEASAETAVVAMTAREDRVLVREAMSRGARGLLLTLAADSQLVEAVSEAAAGREFVQPKLRAWLGSAAAWPDGLSSREVDVLRLIALGYTNAEAGAELSLSARTIETHRAHIQKKTGRAKRSRLVGYAIEHGLIDLNQRAR